MSYLNVITNPYACRGSRAKCILFWKRNTAYFPVVTFWSLVRVNREYVSLPLFEGELIQASTIPEINRGGLPSVSVGMLDSFRDSVSISR